MTDVRTDGRGRGTPSWTATHEQIMTITTEQNSGRVGQMQALNNRTSYAFFKFALAVRRQCGATVTATSSSSSFTTLVDSSSMVGGYDRARDRVLVARLLAEVADSEEGRKGGRTARPIVRRRSCVLEGGTRLAVGGWKSQRKTRYAGKGDEDD